MLMLQKVFINLTFCETAEAHRSTLNYIVVIAVAHSTVQLLQSSCILNPLFSEVETSPCTSAWEHLDSVTLSTMSRATINPPSDISHLVPASKTKWNHTRFYMLESPWTPLTWWINEEWRRQRIWRRKKKEEGIEVGLYMWEKGLLLTGVLEPSWINYVNVCVM